MPEGEAARKAKKKMLQFISMILCIVTGLCAHVPSPEQNIGKLQSKGEYRIL